MQLLVLVDTITPRIQYILNHVLGTMLGFKVELTSDENVFRSSALPKIAYSCRRVEGAIQIYPHGIMQQKGVLEQYIHVSQWHDLPIFFNTDESSTIPFDIFAASFYLIARYEEYLPFNADQHGRFPSEESLAVKNNFLHLPLVDLWVNEFTKILDKSFPGLRIFKRKFKYIPTIDIDNAFAYKHKGLLRNKLGMAKSLVHFKFADAYRRWQVCFRLKSDPFDTYDTLLSFLPPNAIWFWLGGSFSRFDRNISVNHPAFQKIMRKIRAKHTVGLHPSYSTFNNFDKLMREKITLENALHFPVQHSRQHFLRLQFPKTNQMLAQAEIAYDYSMGYSDVIGFRASTCTAFNFYNVVDEKELTLKLIPFQVMDRALLQGLKLNPEQAIEQVSAMAKTVKSVNGTFVTVWHNETLSGLNEWKGWENVLTSIVKEISILD
ncbi:MAG: polysaccharide deacetylase family protein [Tenuifilaceae bacterium]|jgi:hypothetical protein|nr:polysaccharide deacetylase family protein [Tenuifilaceae bacterium]